MFSPAETMMGMAGSCTPMMPRTPMIPSTMFPMDPSMMPMMTPMTPTMPIPSTMTMDPTMMMMMMTPTMMNPMMPVAPSMTLNPTTPMASCPAMPMTGMSPVLSTMACPSPFYQTERNRHAAMWNIRNWMNWMNKEFNTDLLKTPARPANWAEYYSMHNPVRMDNYGQRVFCVNIDMSTFRPEEIRVGLRNGRVVIEAGHEERYDPTPSAPMMVGDVPMACPSLLTKPGAIRRTFYREICLPEDCRFNNIRAYVNPEGTLTICCPLPGVPVCPITYMSGYPTTTPLDMPATTTPGTTPVGVLSGLPPLTTALLASKMSGGNYGYDKMMPTGPTDTPYPSMMTTPPMPNMMGGYPSMPWTPRPTSTIPIKITMA